jgi:predicted RNA-binding Zn-ribbon protein involved in translation (DUF1610 family)
MHPKWTLSGYWQTWAQHTRQDAPKITQEGYRCPECGELLWLVKSTSGNSCACLYECKGHGYWLIWD